MIRFRKRVCRNGERGAALIVVLWLLAALSLSAATFASAMRTEITVGRNEIANANARALADAGIYRGIVALVDIDGEEVWPTDGDVQEFEFGGANIAVSLHSETGKIDLNAASLELIEGLMQSVGLEPRDAEAVAEAILDWRDEDGLKRPRGAETATYEAENLPYGAKNGRFESVDELQQVMGISRRLFRRLAPLVTIYSGSEGIDQGVASRETLLALPGVDRAEVEALLEIRRQNRYNASSEPELALSNVGEWLDAPEGRVYTVRSEARLPAGAVFVREAVVWLPDGGDRLFWILDWRSGWTSPANMVD